MNVNDSEITWEDELRSPSGMIWVSPMSCHSPRKYQQDCLHCRGYLAKQGLRTNVSWKRHYIPNVIHLHSFSWRSLSTSVKAAIGHHHCARWESCRSWRFVLDLDDDLDACAFRSSHFAEVEHILGALGEQHKAHVSSVLDTKEQFKLTFLRGRSHYGVVDDALVVLVHQQLKTVRILRHTNVHACMPQLSELLADINSVKEVDTDVRAIDGEDNAESRENLQVQFCCHVT